MKILDDLNERVETIRHSMEHSERTVAGLREELEEAEMKARQLAQGNRTARWIEGGLMLAGLIALAITSLLRPELRSSGAIILSLLVLMTFALEVIGDGQRRAADHARNKVANILDQRVSILESRRSQLATRTRERDHILDIVTKTRELETPYVSNFVARYRLGTEGQRQSLRELLKKQIGVEVSEALLVDMLEDEQDAQEFASFEAPLSEPGHETIVDYLSRFIANYGRKGNRAHLLRLLKQRELVDENYTAEQLEEELAKREHDMQVEDFGASLETSKD